MPKNLTHPRVPWGSLVDRARELAGDTSHALTLRGLHYRLVSDAVARELGYRNVLGYYKRLSRYTAEARREDGFPALSDQTRSVQSLRHWDDVSDALRWLAQQYRVDRTAGQEFLPVVAVEKGALLPLVSSEFLRYGVPVLAVRGYASQTLADRVAARVEHDGRPAVLVVASDFDPSGEDIVRDFVARTNCWHDVQRVALTAEQVEAFDLPPVPGKTTDSRSAAFELRHGRLVQVELEALAPGDLVALYQQAFAAVWDTSPFDAVLLAEAEEQRALQRVADGWEADHA